MSLLQPYPIARLKKSLVSGFHVFMNQYLKAKVLGYYPLKLPDGTFYDPYVQLLDKIQGLTFFKNFSNDPATLDAEFSVGSPTATFTAARSASAPATYVDADGVIQLVTDSDVPRYQSGYYDESGFSALKGLLLEGSKTNYLIHSIFDVDSGGLATGWNQNDDVTNVCTTTCLAEDLTNISGSRTQRLQQTFGDGTYSQFLSSSTAVGSFAIGDQITVSFWLKGTLTGIENLKIGIIQRDAADITLDVSDGDDIKSNLNNAEYRKFSYTITSTEVDLSRAKARIYIGHSGSGSMDLYISCAQLEKSKFVTSFIPTTAAALTRAQENLRYAIEDNRTVGPESQFAKVAPEFYDDVGSKYLLDTTIDRRRFYFGNERQLHWRPNATDSANCHYTFNELVYTINTLMVLAAINKHTSPYASLFKDGVELGAGEIVDDFINNEYGSFFSIGHETDNDPNTRFFGILQSIAIYSTPLPESDVITVTNILNSVL